jgi:DNA-binding NtrC family response regulator
MDLKTRAKTQKSILVLEDDDAIRDALCMILEGLNYAVESAKNEIDFNQLVEKRHFDVFITDLDLSDARFGGVDASLIIRKTNPEIPIVLITAQSHNHRGVQKFKNLPAKTIVIFKPFAMSNLEEALEFIDPQRVS